MVYYNFTQFSEQFDFILRIFNTSNDNFWRVVYLKQSLSRLVEYIFEPYRQNVCMLSSELSNLPGYTAYLMDFALL
jgi:hypothetical protein